MGKKTTEEKLPLMEFLYKDEDLINSLHSQIFGGDLQGISKLASTTEEHSIDGTLSAGFAKSKGVSKDVAIEQLTQNIAPKDAKVIDLFSELNLKDYKKTLNNIQNGKIIKLEGDLSFRNLNTFKTVLPLLNELNVIPSIFSNEDTPEVKSKFVDFISKSFPDGVEFELITSLHEKINCSIREEFLANDTNSILKNYTSKYLGKWVVIGIFDNILPKIDSCTSNDNEFIQSIDDVENSIYDIIYPKNSNKFVLRPIIIYRVLSY